MYLTVRMELSGSIRHCAVQPVLIYDLSIRHCCTTEVLHMSSMAKEVKVLELSVCFLGQSSLLRNLSFLSSIGVDMDGQCRPIRTALPE